MAKERRTQLPFDGDANNLNLVWRIPLFQRIFVQHRRSLAIRVTRNRKFAVSFLIIGSNWQFGWHNTAHRQAADTIDESAKDDHHYWNLAKCETLVVALLVRFPLSCLPTSSFLWPFWWRGHWQAQTLLDFHQVKRQFGIKYYKTSCSNKLCKNTGHVFGYHLCFPQAPLH